MSANLPLKRGGPFALPGANREWIETHIELFLDPLPASPPCRVGDSRKRWHKKKTLVGGGRFRGANLGDSWVFHYPRSALGAGKAPREFAKNFYLTIDVFELVTTTGLPALMTRAVCVEPSSENVRAEIPKPATAIPATSAITTILRCVERSAL